MKKVIYTIAVALLLLIGIYSYKQENLNIKETINFKKDIMNDYEDIIIKKGNDNEKVIALTFDDGPDEDFTPQVLDILKKYNVKATFFVVGEKIGWNPKLLKREYDEGHEIGNHTFTHINVSKRGYEEIDKEITKTQKSIKKVIGEEPILFRPPYRAISKDMCSIIKEKNMNIVLWSNLDARDWSNPGVYYIVNTITSKVQNGNIILLHDYNNLRNSKSQTIQALDVVIPKLKEMGYNFVTVSQLIDHLDKDHPTQK
ncbi:polysaccharide deacetylase family protein [Romboutsia sp.]|uniref:polysaccharide deacetylase family protein n=1 Tax=Romboutsia sp. TaxID=1965302 RepID=UPI002BD8C361|nr:polysaccharide deacetylase family protein [Romboutsia sp.]HSQ89642.1 polysaccharide deacetylase family protein [Romboutsia sp.]